MDYKNFYYWLEGYLQDRLENERISVGPIVEKMGQVKEIDQNPINSNGLVSGQPLSLVDIPKSKNLFDIQFKINTEQLNND